MTKEIKPNNFEFEIAGTTSDGKLMILVDDFLYGKTCYLIKDIDENNKIDYEIIKTKVESAPQERQQRILTAILEKLVLESREV